jgi:hypothetical protein
MPVEGINGILNVESAALHAPQVGVANTNPQHILSVGSNLYVSGDSSDVLTVDGNVVCEGVKVGLIEITPSYDLAAVSNVGNVTSNTIQFTNPDTGIVATGNVTVGSTLTVSGFRITAQAEANDDLEAITLAGADTTQAIHITNATDSVSPYTGALQIGTNIGNNGGLGVAGNVHVGRGLFVDTDTLVVDSTSDRVGIGKTNPDATLDVDGDAIIRGDLSVLGTTTTIDTDNLRVQDPIIELGKDNAGTGDLGLVMTRPSGSSNVAVIFDESADTLEIGYTEGSASDTTITMDTAPLSVNVNGNLSVTSNVEVGTANLFVDTVNSRVGIGTTDPGEALHVAGNIRLGAAEGVDDDNLKSIVTTSPLEVHSNAEDLDGLGVSLNLRSGFSDSESNIQMLSSKSNSTFQYISFATATQERMRITSGGNVGIGTTNPATKLHVEHYGSAIGDFEGIRIANHATNLHASSRPAYEFVVSDIDAGTGLGNGKFAIGYRGTTSASRTDRLVIDNSGNVGIGVTDPGARLHVNGDIAVGVDGSLRRTADNDLINIYAGSDNTSPYMFMTGKNRSSNANKIGFRIENNAKLEIYTDKIFIADRVGIGYSAPDSKLDLRNTVIYNGETSTNFNPGTMGLLEFWAANTTATRWNMTVHENNDLYFLCRTSGSGAGSWHQIGYLMDNTSVDNIDFTGQHRNFIDGIPATNYTDFEGLIVSANKNKYFDINENITTGANAIQISQSLPLVSLSSKEKDKACFGVISGSEDPESREYVQGSYVSVIRKQKGDTRAFINSVGEGGIWVTNINGSLESGDYITTSNVAGYGQKQDSDSLKNYTVAKITMDCDFDPVTQPVQIIRKETSDVNYWVKTTYENVTEEEYSNLTEENRRTITETAYTNEDGETFTEQTTYQKITVEESKTEREGYELEVRQELVNVLDEHGQLQWEDDPSGATEKAYKIRYLDADGNITDEANAVHKAAFVGCTYHCG